jgi:DNA primase
VLDRREQTERTFLALCIALPERGFAALEAIDVEQHFTSELMRAAARHLRQHLTAPSEGVDDVELAALVTELTVRAEHVQAQPARLEVESLQIELARIERAIASARASASGEVASLGARHSQVKGELDRALERMLEETAAGGE